MFSLILYNTKFHISNEQSGRSILEINDDTGVIFATVYKKTPGEASLYPKFMEDL
jgi:hypothetical protein